MLEGVNTRVLALVCERTTPKRKGREPDACREHQDVIFFTNSHVCSQEAALVRASTAPDLTKTSRNPSRVQCSFCLRSHGTARQGDSTHRSHETSTDTLRTQTPTRDNKSDHCALPERERPARHHTSTVLAGIPLRSGRKVGCVAAGGRCQGGSNVHRNCQPRASCQSGCQ